MKLRILDKKELSQEQTQYLESRLAAPEHKNDKGPIQVWSFYQQFLYAFIFEETNLLIAIAEASGRPTVSPGWWIDSLYRRQGYAYELVDVLAGYLKADGVTSVGHIQIDTYLGQYDAASTKLARRFRSHFASNNNTS